MTTPPRFLLALLPFAVFLLTFFLAMQDNTFPCTYHADEASKARQIITNQRNFNHPLLLLDMADFAVSALHVPLELQSVTVAGRWCAALLTAVAAAAITLLAQYRWGAATGLLSGLLVTFNQDIFTAARYFKEDPALLAGIALALLAFALFCQRPSHLLALLAGAASGLALSGKYVGAVIPLLILPLILFLPAIPLPRRLLLGASFALGLVVCAGAINFRLITEQATARASLAREVNLVTEGQSDTRRPIPHSGFIRRLINRTSLLLPFIAYGIIALRRRSDANSSDWLLVAFPFLFTLLLCFSAKDAGRYFLPAQIALAPLIAIGAVACARDLSSGLLHLTSRPIPIPLSLRVPLAFAALILAPAFEIPRWWSVWQGFKQDARSELRVWITSNLPPDAVLLQGQRVNLPAPDNPQPGATSLQQKITSTQYIADLGTLETLRAQGITHLVLAEDEYRRYTSDTEKPKDDARQTYQLRSDFYRRLFRECPIIWEREAGKVGTHNIPLRLVRLSP